MSPHDPLNRRSFLRSGVAAAAAGGLVSATPALEGTETKPENVVHFFHDGLMQTPTEHAQQLLQIVRERKTRADSYLAGGCVAELETTFARLLGKEKAVFVPTGTLANHLALRAQARGRSRVLVPAESHIYCDTSDCVPLLSHLNLVPLGAGKATFTLEEVQAAHRHAAEGPFPLQVGVLSIESPVRRRLGATFDFAEVKRIAAFAQEQDIKLHLDGARLLLATPYTGIAVQEYTAPFDTVYVSLYKYLGAGTGAILAGPKTVIDQVAHDRKLFGSGLYQAWPYAAVALHNLAGFPERFQKAVTTANALFAQLEKTPHFRLERIPHGTNIVKLHLNGMDPAKFQAALRRQDVLIGRGGPAGNGFQLTINESINRRSVAELTKAFMEAVGA